MSQRFHQGVAEWRVLLEYEKDIYNYPKRLGGRKVLFPGGRKLAKRP